MRVKRYVVDSMPDALQRIRTDLGKDAVIINTKEIRSGGFLGMFSKKKIEVIAATDTASPGGSAPAPKSAPAAQKSEVPAAAAHGAAGAYAGQRPEQEAAGSTMGFPDVPDVLHEAQVQAPFAQVPAARAAAAYAPGGFAPKAPAAAAAVPAASAVPAGAAVPAAPSPAAPPTARQLKEEQLLGEIREMKEMMLKLSRQQNGGEPVNPVLEALEQQLLEQEVEPLLVKQLMSQLAETLETEELEAEPQTVKRLMKQQLMNFITTEGRKSISKDTRIAHFVGPTGVGKTTTIAKLAAEQVLKHGRKVGFITSDTYRIAAVEQLKTYATILNVPLEVVFSALDLTKAFEALKDCDLIFMDTAGRNFRNEMYVSELNALLRTGGQSETFLVLSLTTKYKDMKVITNNFSKFKLDKVLFTKMDETDTYGAVVNLIRDFGLQTSYVANGQNVPDDIEELDESYMIDRILEDTNHE